MHRRGALAAVRIGMMAKRDAGWGQMERVEGGLTVDRLGYWAGGNGCNRCCVLSSKRCFLNTLFKFFL